ncbi:hypothetical protein M7I_0981 [Glarea lozoyensis 74030]|uniref:Uncharacterized protein n=1 Tax=Glarea lozoyensis (strain ATCC 74030 / MF5533) TaxID=1104152 RepID=H0EEU6_GLAL7|nr:hypothetical protein M7I_0981 [Glarea lozoyensis 74030]
MKFVFAQRLSNMVTHILTILRICTLAVHHPLLDPSSEICVVLVKLN